MRNIQQARQIIDFGPAEADLTLGGGPPRGPMLARLQAAQVTLAQLYPPRLTPDAAPVKLAPASSYALPTADFSWARVRPAGTACATPKTNRANGESSTFPEMQTMWAVWFYDVHNYSTSLSSVMTCWAVSGSDDG